MSNLIEKLKIVAMQGHQSHMPIIKAAINHILELESKLAEYEDDITDWQNVVEKQMGHKKEGSNE